MSTQTAKTAKKDRMHPIWVLPALPAMLFLLASDAGNNLSIVQMFSSDDLSLWSWRGLAAGAALASAPLGFASGIKRWMIIPTAIICIIGGVLTILSTNTDFHAQSSTADRYSDDYTALNKERASLLESLSPTDGSLPCEDQKWCDSQTKEKRVAQINTMLSFMDVEVDPLATPAAEFFSQALAYLRAFGVPITVACLAHCLGLMFQRARKKDSSSSPDGGNKRLTDYDWQEEAGNAPTITEADQPYPQNTYEKAQIDTVTDPADQGLQPDTEKNGNRYSELKNAVLAGQVRPSVRQVRAYCGCRQEVAQRYINQLAEERIIVRAGQGWKLAKSKTAAGV